jgi:hypothetical protein
MLSGQKYGLQKTTSLLSKDIALESSATRWHIKEDPLFYGWQP